MKRGSKIAPNIITIKIGLRIFCLSSEEKGLKEKLFLKTKSNTIIIKKFKNKKENKLNILKKFKINPVETINAKVLINERADFSIKLFLAKTNKEKTLIMKMKNTNPTKESFLLEV